MKRDLQILPGAMLVALSLLVCACGAGSTGGGSTQGHSGVGGSGGVTGGTDSSTGGSGGLAGGNGGTGGTSGNPANLALFFEDSVQPSLEFCRTCHVPGGLGDSEMGRRFMLSRATTEDFARLYASWEALGRGVENNRILTKASNTDPEPHSGGGPWPKGDIAYNNMRLVLACWDAPASCTLDGAEPPIPDRPLLGSSHARSYQEDYCEGDGTPEHPRRDDGAVLPEDPRALIRPGVNAGGAIAFNAFWQDCTTAAANPRRRPQTCGEYRTRRDAGHELVRRGLSLQYFGRGIISADQYNQLWQRWGEIQRPADFDAQLRERYGLPRAPYRNPYPLPGENPQSADGGSGELPAGLVQVKDSAGRYTGSIGMTCDACHSGEVFALGTAPVFVSGLGGHNADLQLLLADQLVPTVPFALNSSRGVTNAMGLSGLLIGLVDADTLEGRPTSLPLMQLPGNTSGGGDTKMPAWWNASHRPRKFWDGGYSYDASRLDSAILNLFAALEGPGVGSRMREKIETESLLVQAYIDSLQSPPYPGPINTALAEQGAVLFHARDLWADDVNSDIPRPPTNGSCAGCHGAYSPRYVYDTDYLEDPRLAGIAGYIAPIQQIRTDPARLEGFTRPLLELMSTSWFSYPEGSPGYQSLEQKDFFEEQSDDIGIFTPGTRVKGACTWQGGVPGDAKGYLAPPLHGVWATAPYLHNGSVPDVWGLLDPGQRPLVWRRKLTQGPGAEHGFDSHMTAYDETRLGWRYDNLTCDAGGIPYLTCEPQAPAALSEVLYVITRNLGSQNSLSYQTTPPLGREGVESRKVFNTHQFAKRNTGHDFTRALTDPERRALVEYLKTL